jgi:predicted ribosome quality control (RQC) complex YloA/Tae2 family protein
MKTSIAGIELKKIVSELKFIEGSRIDKIYHPSKKHLILQLHVPGRGKTIIRILVGKLLFKTDIKPEAAEPDSFCMFLRKQLGAARIIKLEQLGNERIVRIEFSGQIIMYIELFGKGNIILCDNEDKIINVEEKQVWKDRSLVKDELYKYPKKDYDYLSINAEQLKWLSEDKKINIVKLLAVELGIGGVYAEEICHIAGVDKEAKQLDDEQSERIVQAIYEIRSRNPEPSIVMEKGAVKDIVLFPLKIYEGYEFEKTSTYNEALDKIYSEQLLYFEEAEKMQKYNEKLQKAQKIIDEQKKTINELQKKHEQNQKIAEKIYENYQIVNEILEELRKARKKFSLQEINEKLKGHKITVSKDWKVKVELN